MSDSTPDAVGSDALDAALFAGWSEVGRAWTARVVPQIRPDHCILATRVAVEVSRRVGVAHRPLPCGVGMFNPSGWEAHIEGIPAPEWPEGAHSVGIWPEADARGGGWNGHLVAVRGRVLVDLSAGQFDRPRFGMSMGPLVLVDGVNAQRRELPDGLWEWSAVRDDGVVALYWERPELAAWRKATDWRSDPPESVVAGLAKVLAGFLPQS